MIKINLFKSLAQIAGVSESGNYSEESGSSKLNFFKHIIVMFLGIGALFIYENFNVPELKNQLQVIQAEITESSTFNNKMSSLKKEIENYEKDLKRLNVQTEFLQRTQKERNLPIELMQYVKKIIGNDSKVWLTSLRLTESSIEFVGEAESEVEINQFNGRLEGAPFLKDVLTTGVQLKTQSLAQFQIYSFTIKAAFVDGRQLLASEKVSQMSSENNPPVIPEAPQKSESQDKKNEMTKDELKK